MQCDYSPHPERQLRQHVPYTTVYLRRAYFQGWASSSWDTRGGGSFQALLADLLHPFSFLFIYPLGTGCKGVLFHLEHPGGLGPDGASVCAHSHTIEQALDGRTRLGSRQRQRGGCSGDAATIATSLGVSLSSHFT